MWSSSSESLPSYYNKNLELVTACCIQVLYSDNLDIVFQYLAGLDGTLKKKATWKVCYKVEGKRQSLFGRFGSFLLLKLV